MKCVLYLVLLLLPFQLFAYQELNNIRTEDSLFTKRYTSGSQAFGDSIKQQLPGKKSGLGNYFYKVVWVTFVLIIFLVIGLAIYKKYVISGNGLVNNRIRIIGRQNITAKQALVIVNIEGKKYALGTTDHSVNLIAELGEADETELADATQVSGFAQILKKISSK